jgi:Tol biopolymer transport system component
VNPLVDALLDPDPAKRPQSAAETAERLRQLTAGSHHDSRRLRPRTLVGIGAVAAIAVVVVAAWWWAQRSNQSRVLEVLSVAPIPVSPGAKFDPAFSPDCQLIAFSWTGVRGENPGLYLAPATGGEPRQLTHSAPSGLGPKAPLDLDSQWSPDGRRIAFLRVPASGSTVELRVIGADGAGERKVRDVLLPPQFDVSLEWTADGRSVLLPMLDPVTQFASLFRVDIDDAGVPARPILAGRTSSLNHPALSPGGRWLAYLENFVLRVHPLGLDGMPTGEPKDVFKEVDLKSFHWSSDDRTLVFLRGISGRVHSWDSATNSVDLVYAPAVRVNAMAATWAESCGPKVMLTIAGGQTELRVLPLLADGTKAAGPSQLFAQLALSAAFSPDGRWIAFSRIVDGSSDLWLTDSSGQRMRRLTDFKARALREPGWSPNGRQIAFHARRESRAEVFVLDIDPEAVMARAVDAPPPVEPRRLTEVPFDLVAPQWSRNGKYLYALGTRPFRQFRFPAVGGEIEDLFESDGARLHPTEERIYYNKPGGEPPGIFSRSLVGNNVRSNPEELVLTDSVSPSGWTVTERGIYYFARVKLGTPDVMRYFDFKTRRSSALGPTTLHGFSTLRASPDGSRLIYDTTLESDGSMLALQLRARSR